MVLGVSRCFSGCREVGRSDRSTNSSIWVFTIWHRDICTATRMQVWESAGAAVGEQVQALRFTPGVLS